MGSKQTKDYFAKYHAEHKEENADYQRTYYIENLERVRARMKKRTPAMRRAEALKRKYGMTIADYDELFQAQEGYCALCGRPSTDFGDKGLVVDHDHETNLVRGLLCTYCNTGLGWYEIVGDDAVDEYLADE